MYLLQRAILLLSQYFLKVKVIFQKIIDSISFSINGKLRYWFQRFCHVITQYLNITFWKLDRVPYKVYCKFLNRCLEFRFSVKFMPRCRVIVNIKLLKNKEKTFFLFFTKKEQCKPCAKYIRKMILWSKLSKIFKLGFKILS